MTWTPRRVVRRRGPDRPGRAVLVVAARRALVAVPRERRQRDLPGPAGPGFDYLTPVEPWQALPATAVLAGIGLLLVAAAGPLIVRQLRLRPAPAPRSPW